MKPTIAALLALSLISAGPAQAAIGFSPGGATIK